MNPKYKVFKSYIRNLFYGGFHMNKQWVTPSGNVSSVYTIQPVASLSTGGGVLCFLVVSV